MVGRWFLVLACLWSVANASNAANQLVNCLDKLHKVSDSTSIVELTKLSHDCLDAMAYYSQSDLQRSEIRPIWNAMWDNFKNKAINEAKRHLEKYTEYLLTQFLDEKTSKMVINGLKHLGYAYKVISHGKVEVKLIKRTVGRIGASTLFNQLTTKATKWAAAIGKYSNHVGILADVAEYGMGLAGYESEGKVVGAVGNTVSGAMAGFSVAGPPGAAIGGVLGLAMWWK